MPRIPQGKFRTEPSTEVGNTSFRKVGNDGTVNNLRQMGKGYVDMANKVAEARDTADALSSAEKQEAKYTTQLNTDIEDIKKNSVNGKYKDRTGNEISTSEAINSKISQFQSSAASELGENSQAKGYYDKYLQPKLEAHKLDAEAFETKQVVDHRKQSLDVRKKGILAKYRETGEVDLELAEYQDVSLASSQVVGRDYTENEITDLHRKLAYSATDVIRRNGFTPKTDAQARKYMGGLPKTEREALELNYNRVAKEVRIAQKNTAYKGADEVTASLDSLKSLDDNRGKIAELNKMFYNTPISEEETAQGRLDKVKRLTGKQVAIMTQGLNQSLNPEQYQAVAEQIYDQLAERGLASSELAQAVGEDKLKQAIMSQAFTDINSFVDKRDEQLGGAFELAAKADPSINERLASKNPVMTEGALQQINETFNSLGIPQEMRTMTSPSAATALGKEFDALSKGAADPTGDAGYGKVLELKSMYGSQANKAIRDYITLGGGSKKGETSVPPIIAIAGRVKDEAFGREIMGAKSLYKKNLAKLKDEGLAKDLSKSVNDTLASSNIQNLYYGRNGEGVHLYEGAKEAIQSLAAEYMAGEEKPSSQVAVDMAMTKLNNEMRVGKSDVHTVMVDRDFLDKVDIHENAINGMANSLGKLDYLDKVGANIDYDALIKMSASNEFLKKRADNWKKAAPLGYKEQQAMMMKVLGGNIMVSNDPDNPNTAKIYIKPTYGRPFPLPMKGEEGTEDMKINLMDYYQAIQTERINNKQVRSSGSAMSRFNKLAQ